MFQGNEYQIKMFLESDYTNNILKNINTIEKLEQLIDKMPSKIKIAKSPQEIEPLNKQIEALWAGIHNYHYVYFFHNNKWKLNEDKLSNDTKTIITLCKNNENEVKRIVVRLSEQHSSCIKRKHYLEVIKPRNLETGRKRLSNKIICDNCGCECNELSIKKHKLSDKCKRGGAKKKYGCECGYTSNLKSNYTRHTLTCSICSTFGKV